MDACCVINLVASKYAVEIISALHAHTAIATYVQEQEVLSISGSVQYLDDIDGITALKILERNGILTFESPNCETEQINYINFAADLGDDGEAVTCAIGVTRGWAVATDDRKPIKLLRRVAPHIPVVTTPDIVKHWSKWVEGSYEILPDALRNIRIYGRYDPPRNHHLYEWWETHIGR